MRGCHNDPDICAGRRGGDLRDLAGEPQAFEEIGPFLWQEVGGRDLKGAKVVGGAPVMWSGGELSPFMTFLPVPAWRNPAWLWPLLQLSLAAPLLTGVLWPVAVLARRRYGAAFTPTGRAAVSHRLVRLGALAAGVTMVAWFVTVVTLLQTFSITSAMDPWITVLHVLAALAFPFAAFAATWDAISVWARPDGWRGAFGRVWSLVLVFASLTVLWVGLVLHLVGFGLSY